MESAKEYKRKEGWGWLPEFSFHVNENQVEYINIEQPVVLPRPNLFQISR